ncbi:MAG: helix-turn-helix transcriptional regulator [Bdellovibrionota bacterium]
MDIFIFVGSRIREFRTRFGGKGLTQEALAEKMAVSTNTISRWETATYQPSLQDLDKLARVLGERISSFFPPEHELNADEPLSALLRSARDLDPHDLEELRRYAEFRRASSFYPKRRRGRASGAAGE